MENIAKLIEGRPSREKLRVIGETIHEIIHDAGICEERHLEPPKTCWHDRIKTFFATVFDVIFATVFYLSLPFLWFAPTARHLFAAILPFYVAIFKSGSQNETDNDVIAVADEQVDDEELEEEEEEEEEDDGDVDNDPETAGPEPIFRLALRKIGAVFSFVLQRICTDFIMILVLTVFRYGPEIVAYFLPLVKEAYQIAFLVWLFVAIYLMSRRNNSSQNLVVSVVFGIYYGIFFFLPDSGFRA